MADLATLKQRLEEVEAAIHRLATGRREVQIRQDQNLVTYSEADLDKLERYRSRLKNEIALLEGKTARQRILVRF